MLYTSPDGSVKPMPAETLALIKTYSVIYPDFINAKRTQQQGRRLAKEFCVDEPQAEELRDAAARLGLSVAHEPLRKYPRDPYGIVGRVRVQIKDHSKPHVPRSEFDNSKHSPAREQYPTKLSVLKAIAQEIATYRKTNPVAKPKAVPSATPAIAASSSAHTADDDWVPDAKNKKKNKRR
eukprot:TRINITY_DN6292_c0_g1_i1.p1 TRINITY_DN6292_c0_g1~~TRINITY_DN6292_c0_g1_i1.p1  ORF type:complete len:187 (+),score=45.96 TRINITY_DN6292_c0_g1_i1:23-562(+)